MTKPHLTVYCQFTVKDPPPGSLCGAGINYGKGGWPPDEIALGIVKEIYDVHGLWMEPSELNASLGKLRRALAVAYMGPPKEAPE